MKKPFHTSLILLSLGALLLSAGLSAQNAEAAQKSEAELVSAARGIMADAGVCALITLDRDGLPDTRVMDPFPPEEDMTVWFGTNPKSAKVAQIRKNPNVTLYYLASDASGYVVLHGSAKLVDDPAEKEKRWKEDWKAFYPDRDAGYLLIRFSPRTMEVVSYAHGILGDPNTWEAPSAAFEQK